ncbi:hypothetical protein G9X67_14835 [Rhizobium sp. WYCCWR 11152]|uniref:hypothetical protein n=1 Tax=Rhizobium sp. WYCCWR 11152 TaxID=2692316 RepID=UPI0014918C92|nr:hypothetical protein [Rhizobium sp. WYCCWR 11152]NNU66550.1 hypothetical protein [Rhizobium sp. WYCCWR 11152]
MKLVGFDLVFPEGEKVYINPANVVAIVNVNTNPPYTNIQVTVPNSGGHPFAFSVKQSVEQAANWIDLAMER